MDVCDHNQQIDSIIKMVDQKSYHRYFREYLGSPEYDVDRIQLLTFSLQESGLPKANQEAYISAAMLVHLALDTHERVADPNASMRERQLIVLAGDFYSGKYYSLLAQFQNIDLIKSLATSIKIINEHKIFLNRFDGESIESFMNSFRKVESSLTEQFCTHFHVTEYITLMDEFLFLKKIISEMEKFQVGEVSILFEGLKKHYISTSLSVGLISNNEKNQLLHICSQYKADSQKKLNDLVRSLPGLPSMLKLRIDELTLHGQNMHCQ